MPGTILFDLDDTLLENEMGVFLPAYFQAIQNSMSDLIAPERMMPAFLAASQKMMASERLDRSLLEVFYEDFFAATGLTIDRFQGKVDQFYSEVYPGLRSFTKPIPAAQSLAAACESLGFQLVVATNPLFPVAATEQRVAWAELPVARERFSLVTSNEEFHFCKPKPAYYAETLGYLGWPEGPVVMIGNDALNDVRAAGDLGLPAYLVVNGHKRGEDTGRNLRQGVGDLSDFYSWFEALSPEALAPDFRSPAAILAIYKSTAAVLDTLARRHSPERWEKSPNGEWNARQVMHHLRDVEEQVNLPRLKAILETTNPFIPGVDTDAWYANGFPEKLELGRLLEEFILQRMQTIRLLEEIEADGWSLPARHSIFGPTDLLEISHIMAHHDQLHIREVVRLLDGAEDGR